jgi:predicted small secreted protein
LITVFWYRYTDKAVGNKRELGKMVKKVLLVLALIAVALSLLGCQTVHGLGEDISWTAEKGAEVIEGN